MGWFEFFSKWWRRPRQHEAAPTTGSPIDQRRYLLAHVALPQAAFNDPVSFMTVVGHPEQSRALIAEVVEAVGRHCAELPDPFPFSSDEVYVHCTRVMNFPCAIVEMPWPEAPNEAFFSAAVLLQDLTADPHTEGLELRYFTLERVNSQDGSLRTMLGEWTRDGSHLNYGDGPRPTLTGFLTGIETLLRGETRPLAAVRGPS